MLDIIKLGLGAVKGSWVNIALVLAVISALTGFVIYYDTARYNAGYNAAIVDMKDSSETVSKAAVERLKEKHSRTITQLNREATALQETLRKLREKPDVKIITKIKTVVEEGECKRVGAPALQLLNSIIESNRP